MLLLTQTLCSPCPFIEIPKSHVKAYHFNFNLSTTTVITDKYNHTEKFKEEEIDCKTQNAIKLLSLISTVDAKEANIKLKYSRRKQLFFIALGLYFFCHAYSVRERFREREGQQSVH